MSVWGRTGTILVAAMLSACAMAPGMKMTEPAEVSGGEVVRVQPITLELINRMEAAELAKLPSGSVCPHAGFIAP